MSGTFGECSLLREIGKTEDAIKVCYKRIEILERKLRAKDFPPEQEENVEKDLIECRKLLRTNEELLSTLHKNNRSSFAFAMVACFICFLIWMLYILVNGSDF